MRIRRLAAAASAGLLLLAASAAPGRTPLVIWNRTPSAPVGLYLVRPVDRPAAGDLVAFAPEGRLAGWLDAAGYAPRGTLLLKQLAAVGGARVCRTGGWVTINGRPAARALARDRRGRVLPAWRGCRRLGAYEVLLLNAPADSLDGRYFGATPARQLVGRARRIGGGPAPGGRP